MFMRHCHKYIMGHNLHLLLSLFSLSLHYPSLPFLLSLVPFIHELESVGRRFIKTTECLHRLRCKDCLSFNT